MKRALVTGGSGDIGAVICSRLASSGLHVIVHANTGIDRAEIAVNEIKSTGGSAEAVSFDVSDSAASKQALETLVSAGPIQVIVNNAGIHDDAIMAGMKVEQWKKVIDVSLNGFFNVTQPLLLPMMQTRWGRIVNLSSVAGVIGNRGQANYAAAKSGLHGASKSLAIEMGSRGITVNVVAPGVIESSMTKEAFSDEMIKQMIPMQHAGKAEDVANLIAFLVSDEACYISGQIIGVNGGMV